jgi:ABC-type bacteriocin/lantibiotic exporter with double-glycine peptidase domain
MLPVLPPQLVYPDPATYAQLIDLPSPLARAETAPRPIPSVPFYSQFKDIASPKWQKVGCGITALAMIIDYYGSDVSVETLLKQGVAAGAYLESAGWTYAGLVSVSKKYGLEGYWYDYGKLDSATAIAKINKDLKNGPVIASVHYQFDPKSTIPHLVVITAIDGDTVYYNDPAAKSGDNNISLSTFTKAWKQRYIIVRPAVTAKT